MCTGAESHSQEWVQVGFLFSANADIPSSSKVGIGDRKDTTEQSALTLLLVVGCEQRVEQPPLVPEALVQGMLVRGVDGLLARLDGDCALARDDTGHLDSLLDDFSLALPDDARDHAPLLGLFCGPVAAGERELHGARLADGLREALRAAAAGDDADVDLGLAEGRGGRGEDDVAHERELAAAAELWGNACGSVYALLGYRGLPRMDWNGEKTTWRRGRGPDLWGKREGGGVG